MDTNTVSASLVENKGDISEKGQDPVVASRASLVQ